MNSPDLKSAATGFLQLIVANQINEAYERFVSPTFRHQNPYFRGDRESLRTGMLENAAKSPHKILDIQHVLHDGNLVAVHSRIRPQAQDRGVAAVHLFRFEDNLIEELWDLGQPVPENSVNKLGMF